MDDQTKKMLLSAAKAAGIAHDGTGFVSASGLPINWNPYESYGDLLGLARKLEITIDYAECRAHDVPSRYHLIFAYWGAGCNCKTDAEAIVWVAAQIGDAMP